MLRKTICLQVLLIALFWGGICKGNYHYDYGWDVKAIFKNHGAWEKELENLISDINLNSAKCDSYLEPSLVSSAGLLECYDGYWNVFERFTKVHTYSLLLHLRDLKDRQAVEDLQKAQKLAEFIDRAFYNLTPSIFSLGRHKIEELISESPERNGLGKYKFALMEIFRRNEPHYGINSSPEMAVRSFGRGTGISDVWSNVNWKEFVRSKHKLLGFLPVTIKKKAKISIDNWFEYRASRKERLRERASKAFLSSLRGSADVLTERYIAELRENNQRAFEYGYRSSLEMYMDRDAVPYEFYEDVLKGISDNPQLIDTQTQYIELKKRALELSEFTFSDLYAYIYVPHIFPIDYSGARSRVKKALQPLGEKYVNDFLESSDPRNGWVNVYPDEGRISFEGAMTIPLYGVHPFVLLNFRNSIEDVFLLAHEFGHAIHFKYTDRVQPMVYSYPPVIMTTEIAAALNEILLHEYLVNKARGDREKLFRQNAYLEFIRSRLITSSMTADFERIADQMVSDNDIPSIETLKETYSSMFDKYYGPGYAQGELDGMEWAFMVHLYPGFYTFNYTSSFVFALQFAERFIKKDPYARQDYMRFLSSGTSRPPLVMLSDCGILKNGSYREAVEDSVSFYREKVHEVKRLYEKVYD
jgi:oligoendopeptidase F